MTTGDLQEVLLEYIATYGSKVPVVLSAKDGWTVTAQVGLSAFFRSDLKHHRMKKVFVMDADPAVYTRNAYYSALREVEDRYEDHIAELEEKIRKLEEGD